MNFHYTTQPVLIIHGGAGRTQRDAKHTEKQRQILKAVLEEAYDRLCRTNALEAVVHAVKLLEDDPLFNAGLGSQIQSDGHARLSASVMDGESQRFAGVVNIERIRNPVLVARALLKEKHTVLCADGARAFARSLGLEESDTRTPESIRRWKKQKGGGVDTVGACALDAKGRLAGATSTGGLGCETPGRVSDSAMPAGCFATADCAVSATGLGEDIVNECLAAKIATRVRDGRGLERAFSQSFEEVRERGRLIGAIGVDRAGNLAYDTTTPLLLFSWKKGEESLSF